MWVAAGSGSLHWTGVHAVWSGGGALFGGVRGGVGKPLGSLCVVHLMVLM